MKIFNNFSFFWQLEIIYFCYSYFDIFDFELLRFWSNSYFDAFHSFFAVVNSYFDTLNSYFDTVNSDFGALNSYFDTVLSYFGVFYSYFDIFYLLNLLKLLISLSSKIIKYKIIKYKKYKNVKISKIIQKFILFNSFLWICW